MRQTLHGKSLIQLDFKLSASLLSFRYKINNDYRNHSQIEEIQFSQHKLFHLFGKPSVYQFAKFVSFYNKGWILTIKSIIVVKI